MASSRRSELRGPKHHGAVSRSPVNKIWPKDKAWNFGWTQLVDAFEVVVLDAVVMREWARMMHRQSHILSEDAMLAATARVHDLQMIKRNTEDFEVLGVNCFNPFNFKRA